MTAKYVLMITPYKGFGDEFYIIVIAEPEKAAESKVATAWQMMESQKLEVYRVAIAYIGSAMNEPSMQM